MRMRHVLWAGLALALGLLAGGRLARGEDPKTSAKRLPDTIDVDLIWNFYWEGQKKRGDILELARLDAKENAGKTLVITHLETRTPQSMRLQVVEHRKPRSKSGGKLKWKKTIRRGEAFSLEFITATSEYAGSAYASLIGMRFAPGTRPGIEITRGNGEIYVYAEGYWSRP